MQASKPCITGEGLPGSPFCFLAALFGLLLTACAEPDAGTPAASTAASPSAPSPASPAGAPALPARSGADIVTQHCLTCHGRGLYNAPKVGDRAAWQAKLAEGEQHLWQVLLHGEKAMPPRGNCHDCSDAELRAAMQHLIELGLATPTETAGEPVPAASP